MPVPTGDARLVTSHLLTAMRNEIDRVLKPELDSAYAKVSAEWLCRAIDYLLLTEHHDPALEKARAELLAGLPAVPVTEDYLPDISDAKHAIPATAASVRSTGKATPRQTLHAIASLTGRAIASENAFIAQQRKEAEQAQVGIDVPVTKESLDSYFDSNEFAGLRTQSVAQLTGGYSKDTFLVETLAADGSRRDFAIRRDLPFGPVEGSAVDEMPYLQRLGALGIPAPRPVKAERDSRHLGRPFLITERIPGVDAAGALAADTEAGRVGSRQLAQILARLHSVDPRDVGLTVNEDACAQVAAYIDYWHQRWLRYRCLDSDIMEAAFAWLAANLPRKVPRSVIVHGDYRAGNALWHQGQITGMVDWEFIHAGDAAEDVEYAKLFVPPGVTADEFMADYLAAGGVDYDSTNADFYEVFRSVRNIVSIDTSWYGFLHGIYPSLKPAFSGYHLRRLVLGMLADGLQKVTAPGR